jgi:hypothetical protein
MGKICFAKSGAGKYDKMPSFLLLERRKCDNLWEQLKHHVDLTPGGLLKIDS